MTPTPLECEPRREKPCRAQMKQRWGLLDASDSRVPLKIREFVMPHPFCQKAQRNVCRGVGNLEFGFPF